MLADRSGPGAPPLRAARERLTRPGAGPRRSPPARVGWVPVPWAPRRGPGPRPAAGRGGAWDGRAAPRAYPGSGPGGAATARSPSASGRTLHAPILMVQSQAVLVPLTRPWWGA